MVLPSRNGHFFSMAQPDYCLCVSNVDIGLLELSKCDDQVKLEYTNDGFFELIGSADKYMDFLDENDMYNNEIKMNLKAFVKHDNEKFFNWDHNPTPVTVWSFRLSMLLWPWRCLLLLAISMVNRLLKK